MAGAACSRRYGKRFGKNSYINAARFIRAGPAAAPGQAVADRGASAAHVGLGADPLRRRQNGCAAGAGGVVAGQERVVLERSRTVDPASAQGARAAPQDADFNQLDRESVLTGPAQRAEYHTLTRKRDAPTVAGDGIV